MILYQVSLKLLFISTVSISDSNVEYFPINFVELKLLSLLDLRNNNLQGN